MTDANATVMLVEPNDDDRGIYETLFAFLGLDVICADHVEAAIGMASVVAAVRPALIVLALGRVTLGDAVDPEAAEMPHMVHELATHRETKDIPLLVMTTHVDQGFRDELCRAGAAAVVLKPATLSTVSAAVASLLQGDARMRCHAAAATLSA